MRHSSLLPCALALWIASASAWAAPSEADIATARALAVEGFAALDAKDYPKAIELLTRAEELYHAPTLCLGRAQALRALGKLVEARESYQRALRDPLAPDASDAFREAVATAQVELAEVDKQIAWVTIRLTGPEGTQVAVDGEPVPAAALGVPRATNPGEHDVVLRATGCSDQAQRLRAEPGSRPEWALELPAASCAATEPAATESASDEEGPGALATTGFVTLGLGGAALVMGVVTGIVAMGAHASLVDVCPDERCPENEQGTLDRYELTHPLATTGFIVGGVLLATGLTLVLVAPDSAEPGTTPAPTAAEVSLRVGPGSLGLATRF